MSLPAAWSRTSLSFKESRARARPRSIARIWITTPMTLQGQVRTCSRMSSALSYPGQRALKTSSAWTSTPLTVWGTFKAQRSYLVLTMDKHVTNNSTGRYWLPLVHSSTSQEHLHLGRIANANTPWSLASKWIEEEPQLLELLGIGVEVFNHPEVTDAMIRQNKLIYSRL